MTARTVYVYFSVDVFEYSSRPRCSQFSKYIEFGSWSAFPAIPSPYPKCIGKVFIVSFSKVRKHLKIGQTYKVDVD